MPIMKTEYGASLGTWQITYTTEVGDDDKVRITYKEPMGNGRNLPTLYTSTTPYQLRKLAMVLNQVADEVEPPKEPYGEEAK